VTPFFLFLSVKRFRKELVVVCLSLLIVTALPVAAVFGMTDVQALASDTSLTLYTGTDKNENLYDYGYCTWWTSKRRAGVGAPIPQNWGDAHSWDNNALLVKFGVDHTPTKYAIMQTDAGKLGHVAFVEEVAADGSWTISEMNVLGWDIMGTRTLKASDAWLFNFIH
jgi:surface antigen